MIIRSYHSPGAPRATYLVGHRSTREAVLLDPGDEVRSYLADARRFGLEVRHVFAADYGQRIPFGLLELREEPNVRIHQSDAAPYVCDASPLYPEEGVTVGALRIVLVRDARGAEFLVVLNLEGGSTRLAMRTYPLRVTQPRDLAAADSA